jgi:hypothetical protein
MTATVVRFPTQAVVIRKAPEGGWLVLGERGHGWLHDDHRAAMKDAAWLSKDLKFVVCEVSKCLTIPGKARCFGT